MRRDEVENVLQLVADRWGDHDEWVNVTITEIRRLLKMDELSDPLLMANQPGKRATSKAAALKNAPRAGTQRERVLLCFKSANGVGFTDQQLQAQTKLPHNVESARRYELVEGGWLEDSGERQPTRSGNPSIVWALTPKAKHLVSER